MKEPIAPGICVVRVKTNVMVEGVAAVQLYATSSAKDEAVATVMRDLPQQWEGELTEIRLTRDHVQRLRMKQGVVREISDADVQDT
jgi:hypothetical protein